MASARVTRGDRQHGDGNFARRLAALAKLDLIVIDDFAGLPHRPSRA